MYKLSLYCNSPCQPAYRKPRYAATMSIIVVLFFHPDSAFKTMPFTSNMPWLTQPFRKDGR